MQEDPMINKESPLPLYHQLADLLLDKIQSGIYVPGDKIPSENQLAQSHSIGRPTVRQAIDCLIRKNLLVRRRGSGTYVTEPPEKIDLFSLAGTMASFQKSKRPPKVKLLKQPHIIKVDKGSTNPFNGSEAIYLSRRTTVKKVPVLVEDIYLHPSLFSGLEDIDLHGKSLSELVEEQFYFILAKGTQHFSISYPDKRLSKLLDLPKTSPILTVNRFLHSAMVENAIYSDLYCRTDTFIFTQSLGGMTHG